jgi:transcriptional regulator of arginine metabolism
MSSLFTVTARHKAILALISQYSIGNQEEIVKYLKQDYNIEATQAMISRDLRKMGICKKPFDQKTIYARREISTTEILLQAAINQINYNELCIVIKTNSGLSLFVKNYLEEQENNGIIGCVADDNSVLVIPWTLQNIEHSYRRICDLLAYKNTQ